MKRWWAALAACAFASANAATLTLDEALTRVASRHPDLQWYVPRQAELAAEVDQASLAPPLVAGATLENALGSGTASGVKGAELTLTLAGLLERGGKREARRALAAAELDALGVAQAASRLDVLAETARRYLALAASAAREPLLSQELAQRDRVVAVAKARFAAGAAPDTAVYAAEAAAAQTRATIAQQTLIGDAAWRRLALLWGDNDPGPAPETTAISSALAVPQRAALLALLDRTPELLRFADAGRIAAAQLTLAQSAGSGDLEWQVGLRRLQDGADWALVGGVSLPLGSERRAGPGVRAALARSDAIEAQRASAELALKSALLAILEQARAARADADALRSEVLPKLERAALGAERAYRSGALSYLEWASVLTDITSNRQRALDADIAARAALIELQRLTAEPLVTTESAP